MVNATAIQSTISATLNNLGSTLVIVPRTETRDQWGKNTYADGTPVNTLAAPDNMFSFRFDPLPQGVLDRSSMILIIKGDVTIDKYSKVTYGGKSYGIISIQDYLMSDVSLAKQLVLEELN